MIDNEAYKHEYAGQLSLFDYTMQMIHVDTKIRLIELFAGYGSQAMAFDELGVDYEHWKVVEFDKYAIKSYNAVHNTDFVVTDIRNVCGADLEITESDKYTYFITYSFPCTDLSVAGKMEGMKKGSGTRSGLLWEVERILKEIHKSNGELPQILFMENVPQVISNKNIKDFHEWKSFLESLGYTNHVKILNAKDYGVAQNRERCFMFSFLGKYNYHFPEPIPLTKTIKDYLEDVVDEKYYINTEKADKLIKEIENNKYMNPKANYIPTIGKTSYPLTSQDFVRTGFSDISYTLSARDYKDPKNVMVGNINPSGKGLNGNVHMGEIAPTLTTNKGEGQKTIVAMRGRNPDNPSDRTAGSPTEQRLEPNVQGISNTLTTVQKDNLVLETIKIDHIGIGHHPFSKKQEFNGYGDIAPCLIATDYKAPKTCMEKEKTEKYGCRYRIRKLTPKEYGRLMAVSDKNIDKILSTVSNSQAYKQFGNSIVVLCMVAMFRNLNIKNKNIFKNNFNTI